ncbi:MAG: LysR family transcriptional regulator, partial [Mobilitalea sp.]
AIMTFIQIRYFVEVAECLNFTEAANRLYVSQQVVSKQIITLEKELDIKLLERTTKQVALTQGGKILYETWKELLFKNDAAIKSAIEISKRKYEKIRIGVPEIAT